MAKCLCNVAHAEGIPQLSNKQRKCYLAITARQPWAGGEWRVRGRRRGGGSSLATVAVLWPETSGESCGLAREGVLIDHA